jgi:UDP-sugar transporter A1/2/3
MYITTTAVVVCEFIKIIVSLFGCFIGADRPKSVPEFAKNLKKSSSWQQILTISLPAALYVIQNNLQYVAVSNLPAEVYQVLVQSKTITTAIFSAIILSRRYSKLQWLAVCALTVGVALVQFSFGTSKVVVRNLNLAIGIPAVLISSITSGLAGVYTEKMMKTKTGFWIRNLQLSIVSFFLAILGVLVNDFSAVQQKGFFYAYDPLVLGVILLQALGGFLVALVIRYTDSIVKGFASAGSIILSCVLSSLLLGDYRLNQMFLTGTAITCTSAFAWGAFPLKKEEVKPQPVAATELVSEPPGSQKIITINEHDEGTKEKGGSSEGQDEGNNGSLEDVQLPPGTGAGTEE